MLGPHWRLNMGPPDWDLEQGRGGGAGRGAAGFRDHLTSPSGYENPLRFRGPRAGPSQPTTCGSPPMFHAMENGADLVSADRPGGYGDREARNRGGCHFCNGRRRWPLSRASGRGFIGIVALAGQTSFGRCLGQGPLTSPSWRTWCSKRHSRLGVRTSGRCGCRPWSCRSPALLRLQTASRPASHRGRSGRRGAGRFRRTPR